MIDELYYFDEEFQNLIQVILSYLFCCEHVEYGVGAVGAEPAKY